MKKELELTKSDFQEVGIATTLNQNDVVEIVAHEIFQKYMDQVTACQQSALELQKERKYLYAGQLFELKERLLELGALPPESEAETNDSSEWINRKKANTIFITTLSVEERDRGTYVKSNSSGNALYYPSNNDKIQISLAIGYTEKTTNNNLKIKDITGGVTTTSIYDYEKIITVAPGKLIELVERIRAHNKVVCDLVKVLPNSGVLSLDKITRDARVKINKNVLKASGPELKKKLAEFFKIDI